MNAILSHPHITELREKRRGLLQRLAEVVREIQDLKDHILPDLLSEYDRHFRDLEIALQQKTLFTSEIVRREELFRLKLGRGEKLTEEMIRAVNTIVDKEFERVKKRFREAFSMTKEEREEAAIRKATQHNDSEYARLYRSIVKKLHPDARTQSAENELSDDASVQKNYSDNNPNDSFGKFWQSAQDAYKSRNMRELQAIYDIVCQMEEREDFPTISSAEEYLEQEILRLESRLRNEERRLHEIVNYPPYTLRELMKSRTWLESERQSFQAKIAEKEREYERAKAFLLALNAFDKSSVAEPHAAGHNAENIEPSAEAADQEAFTNDFMANTYFNNR